MMDRFKICFQFQLAPLRQGFGVCAAAAGGGCGAGDQGVLGNKGAVAVLGVDRGVMGIRGAVRSRCICIKSFRIHL
jgi:hypothetical protein